MHEGSLSGVGLVVNAKHPRSCNIDCVSIFCPRHVRACVWGQCTYRSGTSEVAETLGTAVSLGSDRAIDRCGKNERNDERQLSHDSNLLSNGDRLQSVGERVCPVRAYRERGQSGRRTPDRVVPLNHHATVELPPFASMMEG